MAIISNPVSNDTSNQLSITSRWGITANEYDIDRKRVDLQDLMVAVSKHRAVAVEGEVAPQATRIRDRNDRLDKLGKVLSTLTALQAMYEKDDEGGDSRSYDCRSLASADLTVSELDKLGVSITRNGTTISATKAKAEEAIQKVKSKIDALNNEAQMDMSRLQQLVDRRDESYSTATNLMTAISDTRSNLIRALA